MRHKKIPSTLSSRREGVFTLINKFERVKGFTLIELMVVISIIAILATVGVVFYGSTQKNARDTKRIGDIQQIQTAMEQYYGVNNSLYPGTLAGLGTSYFSGGAIPTDPGGAAYTYLVCASESPNYKHYAVCATLETSRGDAASMPSDACSTPVYTSGTGTTFYCASQLSN